MVSSCLLWSFQRTEAYTRPKVYICPRKTPRDGGAGHQTFLWYAASARALSGSHELLWQHSSRWVGAAHIKRFAGVAVTDPTPPHPAEAEQSQPITLRWSVSELFVLIEHGLGGGIGAQMDRQKNKTNQQTEEPISWKTNRWINKPVDTKQKQRK